MTRRDLLKTGVALAGVAALASCTGGGAAPGIPLSRLQCRKEDSMSAKILVTYATWQGSTGEVARAIGQVLCDAGASVDVLPVKEVQDVAPYSAVVLGTPVRMGRTMPHARAFVKRHGAALATKHLATFAVCLTMKDDTPENRETAHKYLTQLAYPKPPIAEGLFAGKFDLASMNAFFRWMASMDKSGKMKSEDCRDWNKIRAWATELAPRLQAA
jgi:menaquinone-dependent protoporphyrinogen oxidase